MASASPQTEEAAVREIVASILTNALIKTRCVTQADTAADLYREMIEALNADGPRREPEGPPITVLR